MYEKLDIDVKDFYKDKFVSYGDFDITNSKVKGFDVNYFKILWIYSNIKEASRVLDFGCGSGTLLSLKNKNCTLVGVDYSKEALDIAKANGYDEVFSGSILDFEYDGEPFDYIVSLDVFGHISFEEKDDVILKLKTFLAPNGIMLHGIECGQIDYDSMNNEELRSFVEVDGHVGMEGKNENIDRFSKFFNHVEAEVRYVMANSVDEYIKQYELYGKKDIFPIYSMVKMFTVNERKAFDLASGIILRNIENRNIPSYNYDEGFLLLKSSDAELVDVKIENDIYRSKVDPELIKMDDVFFKGWYSYEFGKKGYFRWSSGVSAMDFSDLEGDGLNLKIFINSPKFLRTKINIYFFDSENKILLKKISLKTFKEKKVNFSLKNSGRIIEVFSDFHWKPSFVIKGNSDSRILSVGIRDVNLK